MTTWHWVRHGPTHQKSFVGWRDVPADLSDTAQISRLSRHLPDNALIVSSDLVRASATADAVQTERRRRLPHEPDLREMHFGVWDGMHFSDVADRDPDLSRRFWEEPGDIAAPEGESWNQTARRVDAVVRRLNAAHPGAQIIAVAHFGVILTQLQRALRVDPYDALAQTIDNLSVTSITWDGENGKTGVINHLP
ncbi:histidine phosphatase family protein [uncultured Roseobacter sp.]|uniref:histidine phosphatase family protein n=1 Tax=uncultured Roseobacter sp. TaxID=114847 RepID=UPI00262719DF|nr:histidine phosphatase family protein [uncultured Roseobacter sp.]